MEQNQIIACIFFYITFHLLTFYTVFKGYWWRGVQDSKIQDYLDNYLQEQEQFKTHILSIDVEPLEFEEDIEI